MGGGEGEEGRKQYEPCRPELRHTRSPNHHPTQGPKRRFNRKNKPGQYLGLLEDAAWSRTPALKPIGWELLQLGLRHPQGPSLTSLTRHTRSKGSAQKQTMHLACLMPSVPPQTPGMLVCPQKICSRGVWEKCHSHTTCPFSVLSEGHESVRSMRSDRLTS